MKNPEIDKIAIIGCGWLGSPLAINLIKKGYYVKGSTTRKEKIATLSAQHIDPFLVQLNPNLEGDDPQLFLDADLLIINIPPGRSSGSVTNYQQKIENLITEISKSPIKKLIFISSTSVYKEINDKVDEATLALDNSEAALRMLNAENSLKSIKNVDSSIIRMAGLIGPGRHPGRFFAGKENIPNGLSPVNLIHLDDCIGIIVHVIENNLWNVTFNGAAPSHPSKDDFYGLASKNFYNKNAKFINEQGNFKIVDSSKIIAKGYEFKHPDLMEWLLQTSQN
ncbi:MAG: NAD(P)H-binding protein [Bacteroidetes bacterium]|nr:NAD(P)H-binding protein [Bacteroidota bacterium]MBU1371457.1 NAD(P)H-binding protein [Bacteroidota bacterium]MBU1485687.1 NAD(P)H-binding protein [Bacteroidota bacterium]MBU1759605.1 NAD(P)H-binding protein [Bacteroidota bacterium]MBU2268940.1 NAD(P)H-binding protein [Bacteroidota bacterium]